ncbi:lysophospholipase [Pseudanabaena sp. FACHB-1277]|uniref:Lysophospholipase n=1 Tax=Pseudanabaena cinerea FACHB-1277 TaxID=2949581 RepID=A0A926Z8N2_9CYAN|nr:lysophospholipase [Pseudanabaena cinerea]MBD2152898.1 lysophospholipase [Pseudanabaena cinerea FACHB-1277]
MSSVNQTKFIIFSQHGLSDTNSEMLSLALKVAPPNSHIVAPNLGIVKTYFKIEPLVDKVEKDAVQAFEQYPNTPVRIIATSLGGVIWVEVLSRNREWWSKVESLVLLGSPIGGSDLARMIDPFGWGIGMAKYLGENRRPLAEKITAIIPTLVVAGNTTGGSDGTVTIESTKLKHAHFVCLNGVNHPALRFAPAVAKTIQVFWEKPRKPLPAPEVNLITELIEHFRRVQGITDANSADVKYSAHVGK